VRSIAGLGLVVVALVGLTAGVGAQSTPAAAPGVVAVADLVGTWTGRWTASDGTGSGSVEMILTGDPAAGADAVLAQLTLLEGGLSHSTRREGRLTRDGLFFALVGGGTLTLTLGPDRRALSGEFAGGQDFPARRGSLALTRKS
jgi:hypothetical protein